MNKWPIDEHKLYFAVASQGITFVQASRIMCHEDGYLRRIAKNGEVTQKQAADLKQYLHIELEDIMPDPEPKESVQMFMPGSLADVKNALKVITEFVERLEIL